MNIKRILRLNRLAALLGAVLLIGAQSLCAATVIYGNNAGGGADRVEKFDAATGAVLQTYHPSIGNGRGVVVVGNVVYSTVTGDSHIYKTDATTGASLGSIATSVPGGSFSTLAWDGTHFWASDYTGLNRAYRLDITGALVSTITLGSATGYSDGLEYFNGKLIANRTDGGYGGTIHYDIYSTAGGAPIVSDFIQSPNGTGIAYDGTNFYVSDVFNNKIYVYDGVTGANLPGMTVLLSSVPNGGHLIEDLSVDYQSRPDTHVPDGGGTLSLLGTALLGLVGCGRRYLKAS